MSRTGDGQERQDWSGTLQYVDIGTGQWVLETSAGRLQLFGEIDPALDGKSVTVRGSRLDGASAAMASPNSVVIDSIRAR